MDYNRINKIRKKIIPFMVIAITFTISYLGFIIFSLIKLNPKDNLIFYICITIFSIFGIFSSSFISTLVVDIYNDKVLPIIKDEFLNKFIKEKYDAKFINFKNKKLKESLLIAKHHRYKILNTIASKNFKLYEISMLSDMRFRGYMLEYDIIKQDKTPDFVITNYKYYYAHKIKNFKRINPSFPEFLKKFKLYQSYNYINSKTSLSQLLSLTKHFRHFGLSEISNKRYMLFSYQIKDGQTLFVPPIFDEINETYEAKIKDEFNKFFQIININFENKN